ncbi:MAG: PDZ domain-containing protein [Kiritimatiellia bacterium]
MDAIGLGVTDVVPTHRYGENMRDDDGVYVQSIFTDSSAAKAGLKEGDLITRVAGRSFKDAGFQAAVTEALGRRKGLRDRGRPRRRPLPLRPQAGLSRPRQSGAGARRQGRLAASRRAQDGTPRLRRHPGGPAGRHPRCREAQGRRRPRPSSSCWA